MKQKWTGRLTVGLLLTGGLLLTAAATQGSAENPLVTLGYLNEKFLPQITAQVEAKAVERDKALESKLQAKLDQFAAQMGQNPGQGTGGQTGTSAQFVEVSLSAGQKLTLSGGGELLLRSGKAVCLAPSAPGLVDTTAGTDLGSGGALAPNHLYLVTGDGHGLTAQDSVLLLVRGPYQIG